MLNVQIPTKLVLTTIVHFQSRERAHISTTLYETGPWKDIPVNNDVVVIQTKHRYRIARERRL